MTVIYRFNQKMQARVAAARELYSSLGQGQVFKFFDTLGASDQVAPA